MTQQYIKLLLDFKSIPRKKRVKTFIEIAGFPHYENVCSNILKFYLHPFEEHGLKDLVLNSLIKIVDKSFVFEFDSEDFEVYREVETLNNNRLDLLITTSNYTIGIENKIFHHLHNDLTDYAKTIKSYTNNVKKPLFILLSLNKLTSLEDIEKMKFNNFINITYEELFMNIKSSIGNYMAKSNILYVDHLTDFMKSIENIKSTNMENKSLWTFFKNNSDTIHELTDEYKEYINFLNQKVYQLRNLLPTSEFAPNSKKQWIWKEHCLVHDFEIKNKYEVSVDATINVNCWEIQLFGRNPLSKDFIFNEMCKDSSFLPKTLENYELSERLIYQRFDTDCEISIIAKVLSELLNRIEIYKAKAEKEFTILQ